MFNIRSNRGRRQAQQQLIRMMMRLERLLAKRLSSPLKKQIKAVAKAVKKRQLDGVDYAVDKYAPEIIRLLTIYYTRTVSAFGGEVFNQVQKSPLFLLEVKGVMEEQYWWKMRRWIRQESLNKAHGINSTVKKKVRRIIDQGLRREELDAITGEMVAAPLTYSQMAGAILVDLETVAWKALRIARTEIHSAAVMSTQEATITTGETLKINWGKYWMAANDDRTRETHRKAGEKYGPESPIPMKEKYEVGTADGGLDFLMFPGDPSGSVGNVVNCRCVELYVEMPPAGNVQQGESLVGAEV